LKLILEIRAADDVTVVHCRGRIADRDAALELSDKIADLLPYTRQLILELGGVEMIDRAGLGELALILTWARAPGVARSSSQLPTTGSNTCSNLRTWLQFSKFIPNSKTRFSPFEDSLREGV
jgi:hypothetical protein